MGKVKSELFDLEHEDSDHWVEYQESMNDPEMIEWQRENFKKSVEQQGKERDKKNDRKNK
jgi:hypothetical protein